MVPRTPDYFTPPTTSHPGRPLGKGVQRLGEDVGLTLEVVRPTLELRQLAGARRAGGFVHLLGQLRHHDRVGGADAYPDGMGDLREPPEGVPESVVERPLVEPRARG